MKRVDPYERDEKGRWPKVEEPSEVPISFRTSQRKAKILEAIQKLHGFQSRSATVDYALDIFFSHYKIKEGEGVER